MADLIYKTIQTQILLRSDTSANWASANPQLGVGEIAISTDLNQFKIGKQKENGELASWSELSYFEGNLKDTVTALGEDVDAIEGVLEDSGSGESLVKGLRSRVSDLEDQVEGLVTTGGEANVITEIKLDGVKVDPVNRVVDLDIAATYATKSALETVDGKFANYKTADELTEILKSYVTSEKLAEELGSYVTTTSLNTALANYYTKTEADGLLNAKANKSDVETEFGKYTKTEDLEKTYQTIAQAGTDHAALTAEINKKVDQEAYNAKVEELQGAIDSKVAQDAYNTKIASLEQEIGQLTSGGLVREIVDALPAEGQLNVIYLVPAEHSADVYDEYMYIEAKGDVPAHFELIGNTKVDLNGYATEDYVNGKVEAIYKKDGETEEGVLVTKLATKVDKSVYETKVGAIDAAIEEITKENGTIDVKVAAEAQARAEADEALGERIDAIYKAGEGEGAEAEGLLAQAQKDIDALESGKVDKSVYETKIAELEGAIGSVDTKYIKAIQISEESNEVVISENGQTATIGLKDYAKDSDVAAVQEKVEAIYKKDGETESGVLVTKVNEVKGIAETNKGAIEVLNGNAETEGSVAHTVAAAVNAAKYITSVDESFVVDSGKLSLSETTVFILDGGSASNR